MPKLPFIPQLNATAAKPLRFTVGGQKLVPNDFHVTEIKKVSVESVDCGGGTSRWQELVIQLWSPRGDDTPQPMTVEKFSKIMAKADALSLLDGEHVRFEYGAVGMPAIQYTLGGLRTADDALEVELVAPHVACKPQEHRQLDELSMIQDASCCAPRESQGGCCA